MYDNFTCFENRESFKPVPLEVGSVVVFTNNAIDRRIYTIVVELTFAFLLSSQP